MRLLGECDANVRVIRLQSQAEVDRFLALVKDGDRDATSEPPRFLSRER